MTVLAAEGVDLEKAKAFVDDWRGSDLKASSADYYFNSYNHYGVHEDVLKDLVTTSAYQKAVKQNAHLFRDAVVLDVCAGLGVCSLLAAQAGAKKVIALESQKELAEMGECLARKNGFSKDQLEYVSGNWAELDRLPGGVESVDIIISEWMGYFLLYEARLGEVILARDRWLRKDGAGMMFPDRARLNVALLEDPQYRDQHFKFYSDVWGFDFSTMQAPAHREPVVANFDCHKVVSNPACVLELDLYSCTVDDCFGLASSFEVRCFREAKLHAYLFWFDIEFRACHKPISFTTGPEATPTCWKQTAFFLEGQQLSAKKGEYVKGMLAVRKRWPDRRHLDIKVSIRTKKTPARIQLFRWT